MQRSFFLATVLAAGFGSWVSAEEMSQEEVLKQSLAIVKQIEITQPADQKIALIETPLLRYGDPTRHHERGFIWAWGSQGRTLALCEMFFNPNLYELNTYVFTLGSDSLVQGKTPGGTWQPETTQLKLQVVEKAPEPAQSEPLRLSQMRQLIRAYAAHEFWDPDNSRYELRLLPTPIHRYQDDQAGIVDGTAFVFAHGTNPEIIALVEAHAEGEKRTWKIGFLPVGSAELHVTRDDKEVWSKGRAPRITGNATDPYWLTFAPAKQK